MEKKKILRTIFVIIFTFIVLSIIFLNIDISITISTLKNANAGYLILSICFGVLLIVLKTLKWKFILKTMDYNLDLLKGFEITLFGLSLSAITPSKLGDLSKAIGIRNNNFSTFFAMLSIVFERIFDLTTLFLLCLIGTFLINFGFVVFLSNLEIILVLFYISLFLAMASLFVILFFKKFMRITKVRYLINKLIGSRVDFNQIKDIQLFNDVKCRLVILFFSIGLWFLSLTQIYLIFLIVGIKPALLKVFFILPIAILVGMLPITFSGIGTRDSMLILLFSEFNPSIIFAVGLLYVLIRVWLPALMGVPFIPKYASQIRIALKQRKKNVNSQAGNS